MSDSYRKFKDLTYSAIVCLLLPVYLVRFLVAVLEDRLRRPTDRACGDRRTAVVFPYPPGDKSGGSKAIEGLLDLLQQSREIIEVPLHALPANSGAIRVWFSELLSGPLTMPRHCRPFLLSPGSVIEQLPESRFLIVEFMSGAQFLYLGERPAAFLVLRDHEVQARRKGEEVFRSRGVERIRSFVEFLACLLISGTVYSRVDRIVTLTPEDRSWLTRWFPWLRSRAITIPVSFPVPEKPPVRTPPDAPLLDLLMVANFFHRPNVDGLLWFLDEVSPILSARFTIHLCGLSQPLDDAVLDTRFVEIVRHGYVDDIDSTFAHVILALSPIVSGGGIRMKNLFLASRGFAIITTQRGNEGIGFRHGAEALVCQDAASMAEGIRILSETPDRAKEMGLKAHSKILRQFGHDRILSQYESDVFSQEPSSNSEE